MDIRRVNKKAVESLIKSGAMDCLNPNRAAHMGIYEMLIDSAQSEAKRTIEGQISLFQTNAESMEESATRELPKVKNFDSDILMAQEKEMLGVYLTSHPLNDFADIISKKVSVTSKDLADASSGEEEEYQTSSNIVDGMKATMAGIVTAKKNLITKNGKMMAFGEIEDLYGTYEVVVFPNVYEKSGDIFNVDSIIAVKGTINFKEGEQPSLLVNEIVDLKSLRAITEEPDGIIKIRLPEGDGIHNIKAQNTVYLNKLSEVMRRHPGRHQAIIYMPQGGSFRTEPQLWVNPDEQFDDEIVGIVGIGNYKK